MTPSASASVGGGCRIELTPASEERGGEKSASDDARGVLEDVPRRKRCDMLSRVDVVLKVDADTGLLER